MKPLERFANNNKPVLSFFFSLFCTGGIIAIAVLWKWIAIGISIIAAIGVGLLVFESLMAPEITEFKEPGI